MEYKGNKIKIISGVKNFSWNGNKICFELSDYPKKLWYIPYDCLEKITFDEICDDMKKADEYDLWEWTYLRKTDRLYKLEPALNSYAKF
jgi:hypothetical protein